MTKPVRIAVVDDDPYVLRGLRRLLRSAGLAVDTYASGTEYMNAARDVQHDCILLDLHMRGASGFDVLAGQARRGSSTPVIVITGDDTPEARSRALGLGARACLGKPVDQATLLSTIGDAIAATHHGDS